MEFESPPGTYFDAYPLTLMSDASLCEMQRLAPDSSIDVRRFRPNLLIETSGDEKGFLEQAWRGQRLEIGEAIIEVTVECPRAGDCRPLESSIPRPEKSEERPSCQRLARPVWSMDEVHIR